jgi:hypothetical protein
MRSRTPAFSAAVRLSSSKRLHTLHDDAADQLHGTGLTDLLADRFDLHARSIHQPGRPLGGLAASSTGTLCL